MKAGWPLIALCVLAASALTSAFPTKDEYVVIADDNQKSTAPVETTEKPREPIELTEMLVRSEVALRYASTSVVTRVHNPDARAQEVTFRMLLPETAFISGFTMILSGKSYKAYVKEKEEAKQIYTQAVSQGLGAAHVTTKARDSNHFTVSTNVEGNTTAVFDLRYEEFLVRRQSLYNHAINLHPGAFVPKMEVVVHIKESQKITDLRVPEVRTGNEVDATEKDAQNSKAVIQRSANDKEATVTFTPDLEEQKRLAEIYAVKSKQKSSPEPYIGYSSREDESDVDAVLGQFVVQYDVERTNNGEILVNDGYFVHFLAPTSLPPLSKYVVFVLDTSGSMMGRKIVQLRNAMEAILSDLNPNDYFSIVEFNSDVVVHELKEADEEPPPRHLHYSYFNPRNTPVTLVPPSLATAENIAKAKVIVSRLDATGGTNIYSALEVAFNLVRKGTQKENETDLPSSAAFRSTTEAVVTTTKGVSTTTTTTTTTEKSQKKIENELEPMVIFLTDGDPTVGETNTARILSFITEKNSGDKRASLYSLGFGEDADRVFLRKLSLRNEGFMRHIYEAADAALQLHDFYRQVSSPLLSHVQFVYPERQIKEGSVSRNKFRTINAGSEVAVVGQIAEDVTEITPQVLAFCGNDDGIGRKRYEVTQKVAVTRKKDEYLPLERLWAYLTIKQLLDKKDAVDDTSADDSFEKKALAIALKYEFVTPLTSLVVVKPEETNAVDVESVDKNPGSYSSTYLPMMLPTSGSRPNNAYLISSYGHAGGAGYPALAGQSASSDIQPLALDAAQFPDAFLQVEDAALDYGFSSFPRSSYSIRQPGFSSFAGSSYIRQPDFSSFGGSSYYIRPGWQSKLHHGTLGYGVPGFPAPYGGGGGWAAGPPRPHVQYNQGLEVITSTSVRPLVTYATSTTEAQSSSVLYHLEFFEWTSSILDPTKDALKFDVNGTEVILKLSKDANPPKVDGDSECSNSTSVVGTNESVGSACVYLTRCYAARSITAEAYQKSYCIVDNSFAGVCCPRNEIDKST